MSPVDFIILVAYLLSVSIVLYRAYDSLEDRVRIRFDKQSFNAQIQEKELENILNIKFPFSDGDRYLYKDVPKDLTVTIENKAADFPLKVDWEQSFFVGSDGRSRRAIRLLPDKRIDLFKPQSMSIIAPLGALKEKLTAEDNLKRQEDGSLEPNAPIVNVAAAARGDFLAMKAAIKFSLWLTLWVTNRESVNWGDRPYSVRCDFLIEKTPWQEYLPFYPK